MADEIIILNVGGTLYTTTKSTLCKYPDSMLGAMFCGNFPLTSDHNQHVFIDRDGECFRYILNFLRSSRLCLPNDFHHLDLLLCEADFFQIKPLLDAIIKLKEEKGNKGDVFYLEIIEVRTGSTATMPTNNSRVKTIISGRKDVILSLPPNIIGAEAIEKLQIKNGLHFAELELNGSNIRLRMSEVLKNSNWDLVDSSLSSSSGYDRKAVISSLIIEQTYRDRWCISVPAGSLPTHFNMCNPQSPVNNTHFPYETIDNSDNT